MKTFILCLVATVALAVPRSEKYTDIYDEINLEEILTNRRLLIPYIKCILDKGRCTPDGNELKIHIVDAIQDDCGKCTDIQRTGSRRVIGHLINNEAEYWNQIKAKYDADNKLVLKYEQELRL